MKTIIFFALILGFIGNTTAGTKGANTELRKGGSVKYKLEYASERNINMGCGDLWMGQLTPKLVPIKSPTKKARKK